MEIIPEGSAATGGSPIMGQIPSIEPRSLGRPESSPRAGSSRTGALQVDVIANEDLPIMYASPDFEAKYGLPERIEDLVAEPARLKQWINSVADEVFSGSRLPNIDEFGSLTFGGGEALGDGMGDVWRIKVRFPSPMRRRSTGASLLMDRSEYKVSLRLAKPRGSRAGAGTAANAAHQALGGESEGETPDRVANL